MGRLPACLPCCPGPTRDLLTVDCLFCMGWSKSGGAAYLPPRSLLHQLHTAASLLAFRLWAADLTGIPQNTLSAAASVLTWLPYCCLRPFHVPSPPSHSRVQIEAVENHMPEIVIVDEIGTEAEALACRTIAERGVQLIGTAHGQLLENLIKNPTLSDLVGGICSVTLGDEEARSRGTQKSVLERKAPPTFPLVIEMRERAHWVTHWVEDSVDCLLSGKVPIVQVRGGGREEGGGRGRREGRGREILALTWRVCSCVNSH